MKAGAKRLRCAIYTRVSTEYGLEQDFNSLDAQREACEAYVKSQAHEGWRALPAPYDDGGYSGGSMDRPALQRLLAAIRAREIDVVVVYKVDRLTRSLADFAKLVELFDGHDVSFVSVTQSFNTTNSMGRLTLYVLLSFAQFEREVSGERIRDKIAATKRKGIRVGGPVPLGYAVQDKKLVPEPAEADQVRLIFERYREIGCLAELAADLTDKGMVTKIIRGRSGKVRGGRSFSKSSLAFLLRNRTYIGEIVHKGVYYPAEHAPIVDHKLFDAVQAQLTAQANGIGASCANRGSLLTGRLFDDRGNRMTPVTTNKRGVRYRYYASCVLGQGRRDDAGSVPRVPAADIESIVVTYLRQASRELLSDSSLPDRDDPELIATRLERVVVRTGELELSLKSDSSDETLTTVLPWRAPHRVRRSFVGTAEDGVARPIRAETRARLVEAMAKARAWVDELASGKVSSTSAIAEREKCSERSVRMTLNLAFIAPDLVRHAISGTLPHDAGLGRLGDLPASWAEQRKRLRVMG